MTLALVQSAGSFPVCNEKGSFGVKTELNWELKRFAVVFVSVWSLFSYFRGGVPCCSRREFLRKEKSFLLSHLSSSSLRPKRVSR